jgi:threonyl-tRNA synthetase
MGSIERFIAVMIEHTGGAFPAWLAPVQVRLATVSHDFVPAAEQLAETMAEAGLRVELDDTDEKVGKKIRNAALAKIPFTIVFGGKEAEGGEWRVKIFGQEEDITIPHDELIAELTDAAKRPE